MSLLSTLAIDAASNKKLSDILVDYSDSNIMESFKLFLEGIPTPSISIRGAEYFGGKNDDGSVLTFRDDMRKRTTAYVDGHEVISYIEVPNGIITFEDDIRSILNNLALPTIDKFIPIRIEMNSKPSIDQQLKKARKKSVKLRGTATNDLHADYNYETHNKLMWEVDKLLQNDSLDITLDNAGKRFDRAFLAHLTTHEQAVKESDHNNYKYEFDNFSNPTEISIVGTNIACRKNPWGSDDNV